MSGRLKTLAVTAGGVVIILVVATVAFFPHHQRGSTSLTAFDLPRLDRSGRVRLADFHGKPVVVDLFASWCTACETELPGVATVARQYAGQVTVIAVDSEETGDGLAMAKRFGLVRNGVILAKDIGGANGSGLHDALGAPGMPATAFYSADGALVGRAYLALPESVLHNKVAALIHA